MNPLLQKTEQATLQKAKPQFANAIQRTVLAGKKVLYSQQTRDLFMSHVKQGLDPEFIGSGVAKLMGILMSQSKGTMPPEVMVPAATILLCEGLSFLEDAGAVKVTPEFLAECTKATGSAILQLLGITPEKMSQMMASKWQAQPAQPAQPAAQPAGLIQGAM